MPISSPKPGWAEQDPERWWQELVHACKALPQELLAKAEAIGISYQMHGLVLLDAAGKPVRPSIIWCDSRAADIGAVTSQRIGTERCFSCLLNEPGNFTGSKLSWVFENEPAALERAAVALLPGDAVAYRLTGIPATTASGLSEMTLWDFSTHSLAEWLVRELHIPRGLIPPLVPTFGLQGTVTPDAARQLGIPAGVPVAYRAGDQPNNAFSLGCLKPGDVAATAGTSGVVYGISDKQFADREGRVNTFLHVNGLYGLLLCINGCGSLYSWLRNKLLQGRVSYKVMDELSAQAPTGSDGLLLYPFGNGAERILGNRNPGASLRDIEFARHSAAHVCRAAQEGIAFALRYGMETGIEATTIRAGKANLFQSPTFAQTMADLTGATVEIWNTDGSAGAARGAAVGAGCFKSPEAGFGEPEVVARYESDAADAAVLEEAYTRWVEGLS